MKSNAFDRIYRDVPQEQKNQLRHFRLSHPPKHLRVEGYDWEYLSCGKGTEPLLILPGGLRRGEAAFRLMVGLEEEFRMIAPTYPPVPRIGTCIEGLGAILDAEGVERVYVFGSSFGGVLGQCFVRQYPQRVAKLIIGDTMLPDPVRGQKYIKRSRYFPLLPIELVRWVSKRSLPKMVSALPESQRAFWLAYLKELVDLTYARDWILAGNQIGIDYMMNYTFQVDDLKDWPGRMLIIEADDDTTIGLEQLKALKAMYPQAQVYTFHNAGHVPAITHEAEYIDLLRNFLKQSETSEIPLSRNQSLEV